MARGVYRFRDRSSYKPSEVVGLFILSLIGWMIFFAILMTLNSIVERLFGA